MESAVIDDDRDEQRFASLAAEVARLDGITRQLYLAMQALHLQMCALNVVVLEDEMPGERQQRGRTVN